MGENREQDRGIGQLGRGRVLLTGLFGLLIGLVLIGTAGVASAGDEKLTGKVRIDGSSTVHPITSATAELFQQEQPRIHVTVGISGSGGGFKKFLEDQPSLRTDISDASRPIKPSELARARELGVEFIEVPIGIDGIAVMVNPANTFCHDLTVDELRRIWEPGSTINSWKDVRAGFPDQPLQLYGPGPDSGTFDYFCEAIVGREKASRSDYTASESDNMLVQGIAGDPGALGYFGYAYYAANTKRLRAVGIDNGSGTPVKPTIEVIRDGKYAPLSRPLFMYVNKESFQRPAVRAYLEFFFHNAPKIVEHPRVNYVALSDELYAMGWQRLCEGKTGSAMEQARKQDLSLTEIYREY